MQAAKLLFKDTFFSRVASAFDLITINRNERKKEYYCLQHSLIFSALFLEKDKFILFSIIIGNVCVNKHLTH